MMTIVNEKNKRSYKLPVDTSEKVLSYISYVVMLILMLTALLPCLNVISKAFSEGSAVTTGRVFFWPAGFQLETIGSVLTKTNFIDVS